MTWALIAVAGGAGAVLRYLVTAAVGRLAPRWAVAVVNVTGTLALGVAIGVSAPDQPPGVFHIGLLGGYTTFSTWMVDTAAVARTQSWSTAAVDIAAPLLAGVVAVVAGLAAGRALA